MAVSVVNIAGKFATIDALHAYKIIARMNDYHFRTIFPPDRWGIHALDDNAGFRYHALCR